MGFNFPASPTVGQKWPSPPTPGLPVYTYDGEKWGSGSNLPITYIYVSDTAPAGAPVGALWFESDSAKLFARIDDGNSTQWVQILTSVADAVLFLTAQNLTTTQQQQARDNIGLQGILAPWTDYTPALSSPDGAAGAAGGRYKLIGKTLFFSFFVTCTTGGTLYVSLPASFIAAGDAIVNGRENAMTGLQWHGIIANGTPNITLSNYTNQGGMTAGFTLIMSGVCEVR